MARSRRNFLVEFVELTLACLFSSVIPLALVVPFVVTVIPEVLQLLLSARSLLTTGTSSTGDPPGRA